MMIDLPTRGYRGRVHLGSFLRCRPLWLIYEGEEKLTDFQVKCVLTRRDIPFEKLRSDKTDLFFITSNDEPIPYWIEEQNSSQIILWLKFKEIEPSKEVFWLYFGQPHFSGPSPGSEIFLFFDDFEEYSIDDHPSKWNDCDEGSGYSKVTNITSYKGTKCLVQNAGGGGSVAKITKIAEGGPWGNVAISSMYYDKGGKNVVVIGTYEPADEPASFGNEWLYLKHNSINYVYREYSDGSDTDNVDSGIPRKINQWVKFEFKYYNGQLKAYIDGQLAHSTSKIDNIGRVVLQDGWASTDDDYHDLIIIRKYIEPEPKIVV